MAAITRQVSKRLGHKGGAHFMIFSNGFNHIFKKYMAISSLQRVVVVPVHLELTVGVLMIVLVWPPAKLDHRIADLADDGEPAHQCLLIVTGLGGYIGCVIDRGCIVVNQKIFALDACLHAIAQVLGPGQLAFQRYTWRCLDLFAIHP